MLKMYLKFMNQRVKIYGFMEIFSQKYYRKIFLKYLEAK